MATEFKIEDRKIKGDVVRSNKSTVTQSTPEQFLATVDEILAAPGVVALGWHQYTPYFNDGEPCEFSVGELYLKLDAEVFGELEEDDEVWGFPDDEHWVSHYGIYSYGDQTGSLRYASSNKIYALNGVDTAYLDELFGKWNASAFESVALENFGDHAKIEATAEGFSVDYFDHD